MVTDSLANGAISKRFGHLTERNPQPVYHDALEGLKDPPLEREDEELPAYEERRIQSEQRADHWFY